jgi:NADPH:quinone reductase
LDVFAFDQFHGGTNAGDGRDPEALLRKPATAKSVITWFLSFRRDTAHHHTRILVSHTTFLIMTDTTPAAAPVQEKKPIPATMRRLVVKSPGDDVAGCVLEIQTVPVPIPQAGQVLVQMVAAPINPSDYGSWFLTKNPESFPMAIGNEGAGIVVAVGPGLMTGLICPVGTHVGVVKPPDGQGTYSEYVVCSAYTCAGFALPRDLPVEDAASFFVNPYTAVALFDVARHEGTRALVHTAAASQLGQMMVKLQATSETDMEIINVVRRNDQAQLLKDLGAKHVVVTGGGGNGEAWKVELKDKIKALGATVAFDAVAGSSTGDMLDCLPKHGTVYLYGGLAGPASNINPMDLIYKSKKLKGFFLTSWIQQGGTVSMALRMRSASAKVMAGLVAKNNGGWSRSTFVDTTLEAAHTDLIQLLASEATGKKLRIRFK